MAELYNSDASAPTLLALSSETALKTYQKRLAAKTLQTRSYSKTEISVESTHIGPELAKLKRENERLEVLLFKALNTASNMHQMQLTFCMLNGSSELTSS